MPADTARVPVSGTVQSGGLLLLSARLKEHDTFLTGTLRLTAGDIRVHILTFDDATFLRPVHTTATLPASGPWDGILCISHGLRDRDVPADLIAAAAQHRRDLTPLNGPALRRYALNFLHEATTTDIRTQRIDAIVDAMPPVSSIREPGSPALDVHVAGH